MRPSRKRRTRRPGRKLLGLDLGERRVGVAVSDDTGVIAFPLQIVDLRHGSLGDVARIAAEQGVDGIVIGLPAGLSGSEGYQAREVRRVANELAELLDLPSVFWDERLTTAIADRVLAEGGRSARNRRDKRDAVAAAVMLQSYLDAHPFAAPDDGERS